MATGTRPLYFDNNATTPVDPRVRDAMLPFLSEHFGNPESVGHAYGWKAESAVARAREQVAALLAASSPNEIIFTAGATESMNLAILGYLAGLGPGPHHLISTNAEHHATLAICERARELGHEVTLLPVNRFGQISAPEVLSAVRANTVLVTLMHANNEIGSLNPITEIGQALRARDGIVFHVDAAQSVGKVAIDVRAMEIDLLSLSAHKFYGPKGVGALYVRRPGPHLVPLIVGGGQERGLRSGTHNVPGIVGLGEACAIARAEMSTEVARLTRLRDKVIAALCKQSSQTSTEKNAQLKVELNGHPQERVCGNIHCTVHGVPNDLLLSGLAGFAFSTASACAHGGVSHVMKAIGKDLNDPLTSFLRFGLGRFNSEAEVDTLLARLHEVVHKNQVMR